MPTNNSADDNENDKESREKEMLDLQESVKGKTDPMTIFMMDQAYVFRTEGRDYQGIFVGRYQTENGDYITQIQLIEEEDGIEEIRSDKIISWRKLGSTSEL